MAKTVLIVDDSVSLRQVVSMTLKGAGYDVLEACDGKDALGKLTGQKVHLIISDVNMPVMDGITFVKEVKQLPNYKFTPIIMLTTESEDGKKREGQAAGARAWMVKPFKSEQLLSAVQKLCLP